jgi:hypothetical protein
LTVERDRINKKFVAFDAPISNGASNSRVYPLPLFELLRSIDQSKRNGK